MPSLSRTAARGALCLALTAAGLAVAALTTAAPAQAAGGACSTAPPGTTSDGSPPGPAPRR